MATKNNPSVSRMSRWARTIAIGTGVLSGFLAVQDAQALGFDLGDAANYAVLFEGLGANNKLNINNGPGLNGLAVNGNIGIGNAGVLQLSGPLVLNSNVDFANAVIDNGPYSGNIVVNGTISGGHANVTADLLNLNALSVALGAEVGTVVSIVGSQIINVAAGATDASGNKVFTATTNSFNNGEVVTINGDGTHKVVFNFSSNASFGGIFMLTGGLTSDDVLFNVLGTNSLQINTNGATTTGTFLDPFGSVSIVHSILDGRIFGGDSHDMQIVSGALVNAPAGSAPAGSVPDSGNSLVLLALGLVGIAGVSRKWLHA